jgi:hypothetical protein
MGMAGRVFVGLGSSVVIGAGPLLASVAAAPAGTGAPVRGDQSLVGRVIGSPAPMASVATVDFVDPRYGFLVTQSYCSTRLCTFSLLSTTDGGQTWRKVHADADFGSLSFVSPLQGFAVDASGRLQQTNDGGRRWRISLGSPHGAVWVDFVDAMHGWLTAIFPSMYS